MLRKIADDEAIARTLNRERITTPSGQSWTKRRVESFRRQAKIPDFDPDLKQRQGWLTQAEAATNQPSLFF